MQQVKHAGSTNDADGSVIKVVSAEGALTWVSPAENELFTITPDAVFPNIVFEFRTTIPGDYQWSWAIEWQAKTSGLREQARERGVLEGFKEAGEFVGNSKI